LSRARLAGWAAIAALIGLAIWGGWRLATHFLLDRSIERFLAGHWAHPIAPQGEPPASFSPIEASLDPAQCGTCHAAQYADWKTALHSRAMGPGIQWQLRHLSQQEANDCLRCHAPLAEQKALLALERGYANAPATPPPGWVGDSLHQQGIVCAACHVRAHRRHGPEPLPDKAVKAGDPGLPHGGFEAQPAFSDSRFCSTCHQFPPEGRRVNGKLLENTYEEWKASRYPREGQQCQTCHMPERRHLWRGIHDPETVRVALGREAVVTRTSETGANIRVTVRNRGAGHYLPTYVVPKIYVTVYLRGPGLSMVVGQHIIGRTLNVGLDRELSDTRLAPDASHTFDFDVALGPGEWQAIVRTEVAPGEHYERMFRHMQKTRTELDDTSRQLLHESLLAAIQARFYLDDLVAFVPPAAGKSDTVVAK
jgi:hypothetical protein